MIAQLAGRKIAVFDLEIKKPIDKLSRGWQSHDEMGVACLCLFDYESGRYRVFDDHNAEEGLQLLMSRDIVVGYNTFNFDTKVLQATYGNAGRVFLFKHYDILREIWIAKGLDPDKFVPYTHGGLKLDDVAWETIQMRKTLDGATAPVLYEQGRYAEVIDYCLEDVRIEKTLFEHIVEQGTVVRNGDIITLRSPLQ